MKKKLGPIRHYFSTVGLSQAALKAAIQKARKRSLVSLNTIAFNEIPELKVPNGFKFVIANFVLTPHHFAIYREKETNLQIGRENT